jgi:hypothetical protein
MPQALNTQCLGHSAHRPINRHFEQMQVSVDLI